MFPGSVRPANSMSFHLLETVAARLSPLAMDETRKQATRLQFIKVFRR
jgi:hypothetical protein